jgi:hypothetical protein
MFIGAPALEASAFTVLVVWLRTCSKSVCFTSTDVISPRPLSPALSTPSTMKTPEIIEDNPDDPEPADEGNIIWNTLWISFTAQV